MHNRLPKYMLISVTSRPRFQNQLTGDQRNIFRFISLHSDSDTLLVGGRYSLILTPNCSLPTP